MFANMLSSASKLLIPILTLSVILLVGAGCMESRQTSLRIATAANVQYAMEDLVRAFNLENGIEAEVIISSSGKISTQIALGAPYDIFVSADMEYPMHLYRNGFTTIEPRLYAYGEIVIWSGGNIEPTFDAMLRNDVDYVAVPNPKTAPYGVIAMEALKNAGALGAVHAKLVFGENVGQVNQFVMSGAAEIGITAKSMVIATQMKDQGNWTLIADELYSAIPQGLIIIERNSEFREEALLFYDFMISDTARKILALNGYKLPES